MTKEYSQNVHDSEELNVLSDVIKRYVYHTYTFKHDKNVICRKKGSGEPEFYILQWTIKGSGGFYKATLEIRLSVNPTENITIKLYDKVTEGKVFCESTVRTPHTLTSYHQEEVFQAAAVFLDHYNDHVSPYTADPDTSEQHVLFEHTIECIFHEPRIETIPHNPALDIYITGLVVEERSDCTRYIVEFKVTKCDVADLEHHKIHQCNWLISGTLNIDDHPDRYQFLPVVINGVRCGAEGHKFIVRKLEPAVSIDMFQLINGYATEWNGWFDTTYKQNLKYVEYLRYLDTIPKSDDKSYSIEYSLTT